MGCSRSKLEPDEEVPDTRRPARRRLRGRRNGQDKKGNSCSTTGLLRSPARGVADNLTSSKKGEEDKRRLASRKDKKEGEEEESPRSPSFRFYFEKSEWFDDDKVKAAEEKDHGLRV